MTAIYYDDWNAYMTPNTVNDLGRRKKAGLLGRVPGARRSDGTLKNWAKPDKMYQIEISLEMWEMLMVGLIVM